MTRIRVEARMEQGGLLTRHDVLQLQKRGHVKHVVFVPENPK
jgi:hypothetical protein